MDICFEQTQAAHYQNSKEITLFLWYPKIKNLT